MNVLAISGRQRAAAAALARDGALVAAAAEESFARIPNVGYRDTGGAPFAAIEACLAKAGIEIEAVDRIVVVTGSDSTCETDKETVDRPLRLGLADTLDEGRRRLATVLTSRPVTRTGTLAAHVAQVAAACTSDPALLVVLGAGPASAGAAFVKRDGGVRCLQLVTGLDRLTLAASGLSRVLGCHPGDPYMALELTGLAGEPTCSAALAEAIAWREPFRLDVDQQRLADLLERMNGDMPGRLSDAGSSNLRIQRGRRDLAASFQACLGDLVGQLVDRLRECYKIDDVAVGGRLFSSTQVNHALRTRGDGAIEVAPIPETMGTVLGAALSVWPSEERQRLPGPGLGPTYSDTDVKGALENCRLDYVYEPDWLRLLTRVSTMLSGGKAVAWFQGAADFGPRSLGTRSILCDPSNRYARDNINTYLKQRREDHPLPVSICDDAAAEVFTSSICSPFMLFRAKVVESWRDRLNAAMDRDGGLVVHTVSAEPPNQFWNLLDLHRRRTAVPGLINVPLSGPGEPTACTPRDAIRTTFSSAIDALVMNRFLVMKDYWLLRSTQDD